MQTSLRVWGKYAFFFKSYQERSFPLKNGSYRNMNFCPGIRNYSWIFINSMIWHTPSCQSFQTENTDRSLSMFYHIDREPKSKICVGIFSWLGCGEWSTLLSPSFVLFVFEALLVFLFSPVIYFFILQKSGLSLSECEIIMEACFVFAVSPQNESRSSDVKTLVPHPHFRKIQQNQKKTRCSHASPPRCHHDPRGSAPHSQTIVVTTRHCCRWSHDPQQTLNTSHIWLTAQLHLQFTEHMKVTANRTDMSCDFSEAFSGFLLHSHKMLM